MIDRFDITGGCYNKSVNNRSYQTDYYYNKFVNDRSY